MLRPLLTALALLAPLGIAVGEPEVVWSLDFTSAEDALGGYGCATEVVDGVLHGEATEGTHFMFLPEVNLPAPLLLRMRAKTDGGLFDRSEVYFRTKAHDRWGMEQFFQVSMQHDGAWHEYVWPIPTMGVLRQIRLSLGSRKGTFAIDWVRLERDPYPAWVEEARRELPRRVTLSSGELDLTFKPKKHRYTILEKTSGRRWVSGGAPVKAVLTGVEKTGEQSMVLDFWDHAGRARYTCTVSLDEAAGVSFTINGEDTESPFFALNTYPPALTSKLGDGRLFFCDRSAGVYIPQDDPTYGGSILGVYGNTHCADMPWMGLADRSTGEGMMLLAETPFDAIFHFMPDDDGAHWPQLQWKESMDSFRYPRRMSYRFASEGGHVRLAKIYREYARGQGHVVPLREKLERMPQLSQLPGAALFWGGSDVTDFIREARCEGVLRGVLGNAQHGLRDHDALRRLNEQGYITSMYDSFADALPGPTGHGSDDPAETALHRRPGAGPAQGWVDDLNSYFTRSSAFALRALKQYVPGEVEHYGFNGRFIDVDMAMDPHEDWHPDHTFDRRQDIAQRRETFAWLDAMNLVMGTEHGNDWGIEFVEYTEGPLGGPFWWLHNTEKGWSINPIRNAASDGDYREEYLRYGHDFTTRIPLWQLVYHDCAVSTWYWGDTPGIHYDARPDIAARKDLYAILYGGTQLVWRDRTGYGWNRRRARMLQSLRDVEPLHEVVGFSEMTEHRFLSHDQSLQQTTFASGHMVTVNFADQPKTYTTGDGREVTLAPVGFMVEGPGIIHERLLVDGEAITRTKKDGFLRYVTARERTMGPVTLRGEFVAFRVSPQRWQLALQAGHTYRVDLEELTGWFGPLALSALDGVGDTTHIRGIGEAGPLVLEATEEQRFFAIEPTESAEPIVAYPPSGDLLQLQIVQLSASRPDAVIRYTLDGSSPGADALTYEQPIPAPRVRQLRARAYDGGQPVGPEHAWSYTPVRRLFESGLIRGGDPAVAIDVPLKDCAQLRIVVGDGDDDCWSDWTALGEPAFVLADGIRVSLTGLQSLSARQTYHELSDEGPRTIAGRSFEDGLLTFSEAEITYAVPAGASRFQMYAGVDDLGNPPDAKLPVQVGTITIRVDGILR